MKTIYIILLICLVIFWIFMIVEALTILITDDYEGIVIWRKTKKIVNNLTFSLTNRKK
jgi:hypothetical protein